jgi:hypothetical protein
MGGDLVGELAAWVAPEQDDLPAYTVKGPQDGVEVRP